LTAELVNFRHAQGEMDGRPDISRLLLFLKIPLMTEMAGTWPVTHEIAFRPPDPMHTKRMRETNIPARRQTQ
jgi:hypothetical protein